MRIDEKETEVCGTAGYEKSSKSVDLQELEVDFAKRCEYQNVTVCPGGGYGYRKRLRYHLQAITSLQKEESNLERISATFRQINFQECKEVVKKKCFQARSYALSSFLRVLSPPFFIFQVPMARPKAGQVDVSVPKEIKECREMTVKVPRVECENHREKVRGDP